MQWETEEKTIYSIGKKNLLNLIRKRRGKTEDSINEKPPKLNKKTSKKTDLEGVKNFQDLARKTGRKTEY